MYECISINMNINIYIYVYVFLTCTCTACINTSMCANVLFFNVCKYVCMCLCKYKYIQI